LGGGSAFTSYIAAADLQQAISKYRASGCSEAYYLLTAGHFFNGFTWRLKLTVKPPDPGSPNEMNIHVGLCWGIEVEGEGPLPLSENTMVQVRCPGWGLGTGGCGLGAVDFPKPFSTTHLRASLAMVCWAVCLLDTLNILC
jgi:hypothetical protein